MGAKQEKAARKRLAKEHGNVVEQQDDAGLDEVLQAYKSQDKAIVEGDKTILESIETPFPLPRANSTLCDVEADKRGYFYLFGGEYFDGISNIFLDDLLRYDPMKREWKQILTATRPGARCAHSCVSYKHSLYVFGGEMEAGEQYHHYRDLWKFDTNSLKWTEIVAKNPPSARSGHSAFVWKHYMIIFGGFFEALREAKWYNDVCVFDLQTEEWMDVPQSRLTVKPEPRSACNIALFGTDKIIVHGGFSKMKSVNASSETKVHSDAWVLHLTPLLHQKPPTWERWMSSSKGISSLNPNGRAGTASTSYKSRMIVFGGVVDTEQQHHKVDSIFYNSLFALDIERRKWFPIRLKEKSAPASGGRRRRKVKVKEEEQKDVDGQSIAEDDDSSSSSELTVVDDEDDAVQAMEEEKTGWDLGMLRANMFAFVDGDGNIVYEKLDDEDDDGNHDKNVITNETVNMLSKVEIKDEPNEEKEEDEEENEEDEEEEEKYEQMDQGNLSAKISAVVEGPKKSVTLTGKVASSSVMKLNLETNVPEAVERTDPLPRINSSLIVVGHTLYLYGGILEVGDREITLDDMWTLDLRKRENWECLWPGTMHKQVWRGAVFDDDDSYISTGKDDDSDDDDEDGSIGEEEKVEKVKESTKKDKSKRSGLRQEVAQLVEQYGLDDENRTPFDGESLADYYTRTSKYWNHQAAEAVVGTDIELSSKEVKREGFKLAQVRFDELKPVIDRLTEVRVTLKNDSKGDSKKKGDKSKKSARR